MSKRNGNSISGPFSPHLIEMLESPAWRELSHAALRLLFRIEIEHHHHGGVENGKLPVEYDDFVSYGIRRHDIKSAIDEAVALGFLEVTEKGRAGNAAWRRPNKFRLTYKPAKGMHGDGTHEWRKITTKEQAKALAKEARGTKQKPSKTFPPKTKPSDTFRMLSVTPSVTTTDHSMVTPSVTNAVVRHVSLLSISREGSEPSTVPPAKRPMTSAERGRAFRQRQREASTKRAAMNGHARSA
jgi:hypothetical protein